MNRPHGLVPYIRYIIAIFAGLCRNFNDRAEIKSSVRILIFLMLPGAKLSKVSTESYSGKDP